MIFLVYSQFHCAIFVLRNMKLIISIFAFSGGSADGPFLRKKKLSYSWYMYFKNNCLDIKLSSLESTLELCVLRTRNQLCDELVETMYGFDGFSYQNPL